jgi:hypothetical protein
MTRAAARVFSATLKQRMQRIPSIGRNGHFSLAYPMDAGKLGRVAVCGEYAVEYDDEYRRFAEDAYERELNHMERAERPLTKEEAAFLYAVHGALLLGNYGLAERMLSTYRGKRPRHWISDWLARPAPEHLTVAGLRVALADIKRRL